MNIFICGVPRAGKTTLAKKLKENLENTNLLVSEAFRNGFQAMDEDNCIAWGTKNSKQRQELFPKFLKEFLSWNTEFSEQDNIVDLALMDIEKVAEIANKNDRIICLGFGGKNLKAIFEIVRKFEQSKDYTYNFSDEKLLSFWGDVENRDIHNIAFCKLHNILYIDNSKREEKVLKEVLSFINN